MQARANNEVGTEELLEMFARMMLIRACEEKLGEDSRQGRLPGNVHLYAGQEAIAVGVCRHLSDEDFITSTHRGHGHFIAKGGSPRSLFAEVHGKATGACQGLGGSMHVADFSRGMLGANAIVGGGIGLSAGAALAAQNAGKGQVAVGFFGDGATSEGILSEVLNVAVLWKLPLILVCEHNEYSGISATRYVVAGDIAARAAAYGMPAAVVDGNDVVAVWQEMAVAAARAREGQGPTFIEAKSYRLKGHIETEMSFLVKKYRTDEEVAERAKGDPLIVASRLLTGERRVPQERIDQIRQDAEDKAEDARAFAISSPPPVMDAVISLALRKG